MLRSTHAITRLCDVIYSQTHCSPRFDDNALTRLLPVKIQHNRLYASVLLLYDETDHYDAVLQLIDGIHYSLQWKIKSDTE